MVSTYVQFNATGFLVLFTTTSSQLRSFRVRTITGSTGICLRSNELYAIVMMVPSCTGNGLSRFGIWKTSPCGLLVMCVSALWLFSYRVYNCKDITSPFVSSTRASVSPCLLYNLSEKKKGRVKHTFIFNKSVERPWTYVEPILRITIPSPPMFALISKIVHVCRTFIDDGINVRTQFCVFNTEFTVRYCLELSTIAARNFFRVLRGIMNYWIQWTGSLR